MKGANQLLRTVSISCPYLSGTAPSIGQTTASIRFTSFPFCLSGYSYTLLLPVSYYKFLLYIITDFLQFPIS